MIWDDTILQLPVVWEHCRYNELWRCAHYLYARQSVAIRLSVGPTGGLIGIDALLINIEYSYMTLPNIMTPTKSIYYCPIHDPTKYNDHIARIQIFQNQIFVQCYKKSNIESGEFELLIKKYFSHERSEISPQRFPH